MIVDLTVPYIFQIGLGRHFFLHNLLLTYIYFQTEKNRKRKFFVSLLFGIWLGWMILSGGNLLDGTFATIQALVDVFRHLFSIHRVKIIEF